MTITVLLDLDDTLLGNDMRKFISAYFTALNKRFQKLTKGREIEPIIGAALRAIYANQSSEITNMTAFMNSFVQNIGFPTVAVEPIFETFYREDFPHLRRYTTFRREAAEIIRYLTTAGCKVVIATNPLFPQVAIDQRMEWAGVLGFPYALVTAMENSHACKPSSSYYQEILTKVNSPPETTWMVGDDPKNDIIPAGQLGLKTWWITDGAFKHSQVPPCHQQGKLVRFLEYIKSENFGLYPRG